uniref:Cell division cycle protein 123 n=1 Tax=Neobodo designis TaxID=312471 RepID=A0A7S1MFE9_NEODS
MPVDRTPFADVREWLPPLQQAHDIALIPAHMLPPLTPATASALVRAYARVEAAVYASRRKGDFDVSWAALFATAMAGDSEQTTGDREALRALAETVDTATRAPGTSSTLFFVRLSTRSPKDCLLKPWEAAPGRAPLSVVTGQEAAAMLASSARVRDDLAAAAAAAAESGGGVEEEGGGVAVMLRPFAPIPAWSEVRVFVAAGQVTALSQYFPFTGDSAGANRDALARYTNDFVALAGRCAAALSSTTNAVPPSFIVDLALLPTTPPSGDGGGDGDDCRYHPVVLEVNPFSRATSACHFSWARDHDRLHRGPFEARLVAAS